MTVGRRIRELRIERELTQRRLAQLLDVEQISISRWENGTTVPSELNRHKLARVLEVPADEFLPEVGEPAA